MTPLITDNVNDVTLNYPQVVAALNRIKTFCTNSGSFKVQTHSIPVAPNGCCKIGQNSKILSEKNVQKKLRTF